MRLMKAKKFILSWTLYALQDTAHMPEYTKLDANVKNIYINMILLWVKKGVVINVYAHCLFIL